jgi:MerR family transcriptional regulator, light-induced transcriptional regulator
MSEQIVEGHPIAVAASRSGLSQDVLRVWERRYQAVTPARNPSGQRLYNDHDIERLRLLRVAAQAGRNIASIARLPTTELEKLVQGDEAARAESRRHEPARLESTVDDALVATRSLDPDRLSAVLNDALALGGVSSFVEAVAVPLLRRIGDEWHAGTLSSAAEHMASSVTEGLLFEAMSRLKSDDAAPRIVVATPAGERHALGAVVASVTAASVGWNVVHLGPDLPAAEIAWAATSSRASIVALSVLYVANRRQTVSELRNLREHLGSDVQVFVGGAAAASLQRELGGDFVFFHDLASLREALSGFPRAA